MAELVAGARRALRLPAARARLADLAAPPAVADQIMAWLAVIAATAVAIGIARGVC